MVCAQVIAPSSLSGWIGGSAALSPPLDTTLPQEAAGGA